MIELLKYITHCRLLKRDLDLFQSDEDFTSSNNKIMYAIDFSEIFAYSMPSSLDYSFLFFPTEDDTTANAIQYVALKELFESNKYKLALIDPYAIEIESFITRIKYGAIIKFLKLLPSALQEYEYFSSTKEFLHLKDIANNYLADKKSFSDTDLDLFIEYLERFVPSILAITEHDNEEAISTIDNLMKEDIFSELDNFVEMEIHLDDKIENRWFKNLARYRGSGNLPSSRLDAKAISILAAVNYHFMTRYNKSRKLVLITRSVTMHKIMHEECEQGLWSDYGGYLLRHPRAFMLNALVGRKYSLNMRRRLVSDALDALLDIVNDLKRSHKIEMIGSHYSTKRLLDLEDDWHSIETLAISLAESLDKQVNNRHYEERKRYLRFIQVLKNYESLTRYLIMRFDKVTNQLGFKQHVIGLEPTLITDIFLKFKEKTPYIMEEQEYSDETAFKTTMLPIPYELHLYTRDAKNILKTLTEQEKINIAEWLNAFKKTDDIETDYEIMLVMAYLFCSMNIWSTAEIYCKSAIEMAENANFEFVYEGLFLLALCHRKENPDTHRLEEGVQLLEKASVLKEQRIEKKYTDPRYIIELATQVLKSHEKKYEYAMQDGFYNVDDALDLLDNALNLIMSDNIIQKIQIYNNILYFAIKLKGKYESKQYIPKFRYLETMLQTLEKDESKWQPAVLHTLAVAERALSKKPRYDVLTQRLDYALDSIFLPTDLRETIIREKESVLEHIRKNK
jgi:hypothetical protein